MFDKNKFAQILKKINETYSSQRDFSKKSGINRTYLSQYINLKLDEPPKPKTLEKLANASNKIITYNELMKICGYIDDDYFLTLQHLKDEIDKTESHYLDMLVHYKLSKNEKEIYNDLSNIIDVYQFTNHSNVEIDNELNSYFNNIDFISDESKQKIIGKIKLFIEYCIKTSGLRDDIATIKYNYKHNKIRNNSHNLSLSKSYNTALKIIPILRHSKGWL